jgi:hypothetical protein
MDTYTYSVIANQLALLVRSMALRLDVKMVGTLLTGKDHGKSDTQIDIVNGIEAEDGSGTKYIVEFKNGTKLYADLGKAYVVAPSSFRIDL